MKFSHTVKQKTKIALLLFCIMCCIITIRILEDSSIIKMGESFQSMYQDRLVPATDLFHIAERIYAKKHLIETVHYQIDEYQKIDREVDAIIAKYQKTYLVKSERNALNKMKALITKSRALELAYLENQPVAPTTKTSIDKIYSQISYHLGELTSIQTKVGKDLMAESTTILNGSKLYSLIQFSLAIVIGVLIVSLIFTSNVVRIRQERFRLN